MSNNTSSELADDGQEQSSSSFYSSHTFFADYLKERFGISSPSWLEFLRKGKRWFALSKPLLKLPSTRNVALERVGLPAGTVGSNSANVKPSSNLLQLIGELAIRNVVFIKSSEDAKAFALGRDLDKNSFYQPVEGMRGYVIVADARGRVLGCSLLKEGKLINQIAKSRRLKG